MIRYFYLGTAMYELLFDYFQEKTDMDRETFQKISRHFVPRNARRNEILLYEGDVCLFNLFVNKGCVRFYVSNEEGIELTRYFAFEGKFGTALSSLIEQKPSFETIQCVEKSELLYISRKDFYHLVKTCPQVNEIYRDILEMAYITSQQRIYDFQGKNALERLKWLMDYQPKILARLTNKVIASYLGVTPYTLSRLKSQL